MKLTAGTVIETLIALVVVMLVFGISIVIYENVTGGRSAVRQLTANLLLNDEMIKVVSSGSFIDDEIQTGDMKIVKIVEKYDNNENLLLITLKCVDKNGKEIQRKQQLFYNR